MILCSGCSFTIGSHKDKDNNDVDYDHWPVFIPNSKNIARGGAGNRLIARQILDNIAEDTKAICVMWSTLERYDFYDPVLKGYKCEGASYTGSKQNYLKYFYSEFSQIAKSLEYFLLIQNICQAKCIPYVPMHMGDVRYKDWDQDKAYGYDTSSGALRVLTDGEKENPEDIKSFLDLVSFYKHERQFIQKLWDQVEWDKWLFNHDWGGFWQFTNDNEYDWIASHPGEQAHKAWAEQKIIPRLKQLKVI